MNDEKLKRAKEVFIRGFCNLDFLKDDDEWKEYNVPYEIVLKWAKEDIEFEFDEISKALKFNEQLLEKRKKNIWHLCYSFRHIQHQVSRYNLKEYYERIVNTYELINYDEFLIASQVEYNMYDRGAYLCSLIIRDKKAEFYSSEYDNKFEISDRLETLYFPYNLEDNFFGLLPILYNLKRMDLVYRLLNVSCDVIINFGNNSIPLIRDLVNYANRINDDKFSSLLKDSIRKWLITNIKIDDFEFGYIYHRYYGFNVQYKKMPTDELLKTIFEFIDFNTIHFDKELEIKFVRRLFIELYSNYGKTAFQSRLIKDTLDYYGIEKNILEDWKNKLSNIAIEILENRDGNLEVKTDYIDMNKHSKYYIDYFKNKNFGNRYIWEYIDVAFGFSKYGEEKIDVLNRYIRLLLDNEVHGSLKYIYSKIITDDAKDGYLVKYYKENNKELFDLYLKLAINIFSHKFGCLDHDTSHKCGCALYEFGKEIGNEELKKWFTLPYFC